MVSSLSPATWSVMDVAVWASRAGLSQDTISALTTNQVDGPTLVTLRKADLRSELGIASLPARRYLWDLLESLQAENESNDYAAAVDAHQEEIMNMSWAEPSVERGADEASGGSRGAFSFSAIQNELVSDAERQRQTIADHLMAHRIQRTMQGGLEVYEDAQLAHQEQERLNNLLTQAESDREYAESLATTTREREAVAASRQAETQEQAADRGNLAQRTHLSSLFGLAVQNCASTKRDGARAFATGKVKPVPDPVLVSDDDSDDDENPGEDRKPAAIGRWMWQLPSVEHCDVCFEENVKGYNLACGHLQCTRCTKKLFKTALKDTSLLPLRCCEIPIDMNIAAQLLQPDKAAILMKRMTELEAKNKMYCPSCNHFLNLDLIDCTRSIDLICGCGTSLCTQCKTVAHPGLTCTENKSSKSGSDELMLKMSREQGWKQCPKCSMVIELRSGCNHMTCASCKHEFCFTCLKQWSTENAQCSSGNCALWDEGRLLEAGEARVQQEEAARGQVLRGAVRRERLRHAVEGLRLNEVCAHEWTRSSGYKGECPNCSFEMYAYGMRCRSDCGSTVCYTCAHHRIPQRGWR